MMMHLVTAWKTEAREGDPKVLYCGFDAQKATQIAGTAPAQFLRVEKAFVNESYKQRRPTTAVSPARTVAQSEPEPKPDAAANAETNDAAGDAPKDSPKRKIMKKILFAVLFCASLSVAHAQTPLVINETGHGTQFGTKSTQGYGVLGATPAVQQPNTSTLRALLQKFGFMAPGGLDYNVQHVKVSLTAAQINGMAAAPVQLIAAQGAGTSIVVTKFAFNITRTSTAFASGGAVIVQYGSTVTGGGTQSLDSTIASTVITGAAGTTVTLRNGAVITDLAAASIQNVGLYISNATGAFTTGTGAATGDVWYYVY